MINEKLIRKSEKYLKKLCVEIPERCVGTAGNKLAAEFFEQEIIKSGWRVKRQKFSAIKWESSGAELKVNEKSFKVYPSPYSNGCEVESEVVSASTLAELKQIKAKDKILVLYGDIAGEQLMPKNFVFYNPEEHQQIVSLLEKKSPAAIICATSRNSALAGGMYPFPLIEDGDFDIPSVYMTDKEGAKFLAEEKGKSAYIKSLSKRIPEKGWNAVARKGRSAKERIVITAHIDSKNGTPGAIDNATGVIILLILAELMKKYNGRKMIEIAALNGEDYYAVPGQMKYISENNGKFEQIFLNINIDGAGYKKGKTAFSFFGLPEWIQEKAEEILRNFSSITRGPEWPQGDHSIFIQFGCPAVAVSSKWLIDNPKFGC